MLIATHGESPETEKANTEHAASAAEPFGFTMLDPWGSGDWGFRAAASTYAVATGRDVIESKGNAKALGATLRAQVASSRK